MPIVLYYLEEMSYKEIAACLSMPMGTVKTNIHRGLLRLRRELGEDSDAHV
jgi:RNA polymerase sigma-70 factor (ECF subfamily)